jgi:hypothetical protein
VRQKLGVGRKNSEISEKAQRSLIKRAKSNFSELSIQSIPLTFGREVDYILRNRRWPGDAFLLGNRKW